MSATWGNAGFWKADRSQSPAGAADPNERRSDKRYPIRTELVYRITRGRKIIKAGRGLTIDMSSAGVLFKSRVPLVRGLKIELCIKWPASAGGPTPLELYAEGRTVRVERNLTAVQIRKSAFRGQQVC